ncbi:MAG TPA: DegV family protein [Actinomycetota bacterium]
MTDSAANLPTELASELGIEIVPMYLKFGDRVYRDGVDLAPADFYRRLVADAEVASTSTPAPADFLEAYQRTGAEEIVCITVASGMSAANHEASMAAERYNGRVVVVDSLNASMAQGFVAVEAARSARSGAGVTEVTRRAQQVAGMARLMATIDTFDFLRRSGRVRKLQAYAATMLDIKPVFRFAQGEVSPVARPRTRRRALDRLVQETVADVGGRPVHLATIHANAEEEARTVGEAISRSADVVEAIITGVTPVIGAHTGPGLVGTAYFCDA